MNENEILNLMSNQIMMNRLEPVPSCIYSVMSDGYTDGPNKELLSFCMR